MINPRFILIMDFLQNWNWMSKAESIIFSSLTPLVTTFLCNNDYDFSSVVK